MQNGESGVLYLLSGTAYAARLVVSIASLRRHYDGPVEILTTDSAARRVAGRLAADQRLNVQLRHVARRPMRRRKSAWLFKTELMGLSNFSTTAYLDCDTLIAGPISELFQLPDPEHVIVTQFCNWVTTGRIMSRRIRSWQDTHSELVPAALSFGPAINTGVFSFTRKSRVRERWQEVAHAGRHHFIPDELAMQLLLPECPHIVLDGRFNCSSLYGDFMDPQTRIVHFHGNRHLTSGELLWSRAYQTAFDQNLGALQEWSPSGDQQLEKHLQSESTVGQSR